MSGADAAIYICNLLLTCLGVEVGEYGMLLRREAVLIFLSADGLDKEGGVTGEITHGLETFQIILHILAGEAMHLIPVC